MDVRVGPSERLDAEELMLLNCDAEEDSWESLGLQREHISSILKEVNPEYSLEILLLKFQYFGQLMQRAESLEKTLIMQKIEGRRRRDDRSWVASLTQWTWVWASSERWWRTGKPSPGVYWGLQRVRHNWATERKEEKAILRLSLSLIVKKRIVKHF